MDNDFIKLPEEFDIYSSTNEAIRKWGFILNWPKEPLKFDKKEAEIHKPKPNQLPLL